MPKQFLELSPGRPLLVFALETFHSLAAVSDIVLVLPPDFLAEYRHLTGRYPKLTLVEGGEARWQSVQAGVKALPPACDLILIHDAARPFIRAGQIQSCIDAVAAGHCCTLAMPCVDTIKKTAGEKIVSTLDRNHLIAVQTPQGFSRRVLDGIYRDRGGDPGSSGAMSPPTDECVMAEEAGHPVLWVQGGQNVRKITDAEDWEWARWMASRWSAPEQEDDRV